MMGKTQRFSKGYSSGFVPDYRHAVETVGESDGFGSSGRVDSEDSSAPKRKCISLNADNRDSFNVPLEVLSLSKMTKSERKALQLRLREELEQVQIFQKKMSTSSVADVNGVALSSSGGVHLKKHDLTVQNGSTTLKRGNSGRFESAKQAPPPPPLSVSNSYILLMKQCEALLKRVMSHQHSWVFNTPVDVVKLNIPDYFQVIKHPMDLGTVKSKIASGSYGTPLDFVSDVRLTFTNAMTYNPPGNDVHTMAQILSKFFETRWKSIEKKMAAIHPGTKGEARTQKPVLQTKKRKTSPILHDIVEVEPKKRKITYEEKRDLINHLQNMEEMPPRLIEFLRTHSDNVTQTDVDEVEIDVDSYSDEMLLQLKKIVDDYLAGKQSGIQARSELCEMEILNESGLSNSSMHPCKVNNHADEDVDIVGNDPPVSSYPPVVIEKDTALRNGKCSSSSSSSSDSGSSSSDSDSGSSSGSESDIKVASPKKDVKEIAQIGENLDHERTDAINPFDENRFSNGSSQQEQEAYLKPDASEADCNRVGGNAQSERQVSPDKLYRAALLRSRFADTILKAREKTLEKVEKKDPEKVRRDREELERLQREEKARLQAEAKAAEDARRQAEAEAAAHAAAEAKRKRELEREAARQALLQMEKSVEINENFALKDLEMLRTAPGEQLASSVGETSPSHSQEGIGGFKLGEINPLEQLGLYMKVDDEEEEEVETSGAAPINDVEEGEID